MTLEKISYTMGFMEMALVNGAHLKDAPPRSRLNRCQWERNVDITTRYALGIPLTIVCQDFLRPNGRPLSVSRIRTIAKRTIEWLWENCPPEVKERYPWQNFRPRIFRFYIQAKKIQY